MAPLPKSSPKPPLKYVRNRGPFPYIQSEGGFIEIPGTRGWKRQHEAPFIAQAQEEGRPALPVSLQTAECGTVVLNETELEAMVRYRQAMDLMKPLVKLSKVRIIHGGAGKPTSTEVEDPGKWLPRKPDPYASPLWAKGLSPWDRLAMHHTLNSVRSNARMNRPLVVKSDIEFILNSIFDQSSDLWANKNEVVFQAETCDIPTWKVFKNNRVEVTGDLTVDVSTPPEPEPSKDEEGKPTSDRQHPLRYGGITAKLSPHSVKLAISGNHVSQTNAGYSRKVGGSFYS